MKQINSYFGVIKANQTHILYAFENVSPENQTKTAISIDCFGSCICFVLSGTVFTTVNGKAMPIYEGLSFCTKNGFDALLSSGCRIVVFQTKWKDEIFRIANYDNSARCNYLFYSDNISIRNYESPTQIDTQNYSFVLSGKEIGTMKNIDCGGVIEGNILCVAI